MINFPDIAAAALRSAERLLPMWLPQGRFDGHEYKSRNPKRADAREGSFSINVNTGLWSDFATGDKGGDLTSLNAYLFDRSQVEAARSIQAELGIAPDKAAPNRSFAKAGVGEKSKTQWEPLLIVPAHAPPPPKGNPYKKHHGKPQGSWCYRTLQGDVSSYVYRYPSDRKEGGKEFIPCCWARNKETGKEEWRYIAPAVPRLLYGLEKLVRTEDDTALIIVEGEKCADALQKVLPHRAVLSWPGGSNAVDKANWSDLNKRKVIIWPDNDEPGRKAAKKIQEILTRNECQVQLINVPADKPEKWDCADAIDGGWDKGAISRFIADNLVDKFDEKQSSPSPADAGDGGGRKPKGWRNNLRFTDKGKLRDIRDNIELFLRHHPAWKGVIGWDDFASRVVRRKAAPWEDPAEFEEGREWLESDDYRLGKWLNLYEGLINTNRGNLTQAVEWIASENKFNPVRDYFDSLKWDGKPRLDTWLTDYMGAIATPYVSIVGRKWLLSVAARVFNPGCMVRTIPVLEGAQYQGKSTALRILGGKWFSDAMFDLKDKDTYQKVQGVLIYEVAEMDSFSKAEATQIKAFVSSQVDRFRAPYERKPRDFPRQTVFVGTTNQSQYLKDATGNSRFWPVAVGSEKAIDLVGLQAARDQLFAEAVHRYKDGEPWHPSFEEQRDILEPEQSAREVEDPWEAAIRNFLRQDTREQLSMLVILTEALKFEVHKLTAARSESIRVGQIMARIGWSRQKSYDPLTKTRAWVYNRPNVADYSDEGAFDEPPF